MSYSIFLIHGTAKISPRNFFAKKKPRHKWMDTLSESLSKETGTVKCFYWSGRLFGAWSNREIQSCADAISTFLKKSTNKVVFISKSNGAQLLENSLSLVPKKYLSEKEFIELRLATPLKGSQIHANWFRTRTICISPTDRMYKLGKLFFKPLFPAADFDDCNLLQISFEDFCHGDFNENIIVKRESDIHPFPLYELYAKIIISNAEFSWGHYWKA